MFYGVLRGINVLRGSGFLVRIPYASFAGSLSLFLLPCFSFCSSLVLNEISPLKEK